MMHNRPIGLEDEPFINNLHHVNGEISININDSNLLHPTAYLFSPQSSNQSSNQSSKEGSLSPDSKDSRSRCQTPELDPWALPELRDQGLSWNELTSIEKFGKILVNTIKLIALLTLLYFFICSLDFLSSSFRLIGGRAAGKVISNSDLLKNPIVGLMIGVLVTVLVQSSSTSTSIAVTMVASELITVRNAIPIVMGANVGTSVTNTIVSLMQASDRNEFRRAFAAATVHDMFNWLTVILLMPLEITFHYLENLTNAIMSISDWKQEESGAKTEFLNKLTKPFTKMIIELDKKLLNKLATSNETIDDSISLIKKCCIYSKQAFNQTPNCLEKCTSLMSQLGLDDTFSGVILLVVSLIILCTCLILMVKLLHSMLKGQIALVIKKTINADYEFPYSMFVDYLAILVGCIMTILVQSSSIFTSALTPLAGIGVISLERIYPLTLGSNIGTTTTGILAALAADSRSLRNTLQLAFCHLFFNVTGIVIFYPLPFMRFPIVLARMLGNITARYRWFSVFYLILMFFLLPLFVFGLSLAGKWALFCIGGPILIIIAIICIINIIQNKKPSLLPFKLQNWNFLPIWMHSLDPYDALLIKLLEKASCFGFCIAPQSRHDGAMMGIRPNVSQLQFLPESKRNFHSETNLMHIYENDASYVTWNGFDTKKMNYYNESTIL